ncbi:MAG TPA: nucleotide sugar dehydrogenase [Methylomirabilota bacterium]|nr:nucleotide sugar dehydrogenase [Methylomirabilota bacterium]
MNITVLGLWHLGSVTAACCAKHFDVTGLDFDEPTVAKLSEAKAPLLEPGLNELLAAGLANNSLRFTTDAKSACANAELLWLCYDTPVNENDESDVTFVLERLHRALPHLPTGVLILISSQLPVGTCGQLEREFPQFHFACSPENLRLGKAIESFEKPERVIVGLRDDSKRAALEQLFKPFTSQVLFMRTESAEMVKHALNSFLAVSITFINEIARLCEHVGADAKEVAAGLKSEPRIGPRAYLGPGGPFAGGTLARDVVTLTQLGARTGESLSLVPAIKQSNDAHRGWALRQVESRLGELTNKTIAVLGLVYTPNTNTLRRSAAVELCQRLHAAGARVQAFDPVITKTSPELGEVTLVHGADAALAQADAAVVCTEWPQFREVDWTKAIATMRRALVIDANRFLEKPLQGIAGVEHISVGHA